MKRAQLWARRRHISWRSDTSQMSSSITAADSALDQLEALLQLVAVNVHQLPPPSDGAKSHFDQVRQLSVDEAWTSLRQLQLWLASFPTNASAHIVRCLCIFLKAFQAHTVPPDLKDVRRTTVQAVRTESPTHARVPPWCRSTRVAWTQH